MLLVDDIIRTIRNDLDEPVEAKWRDTALRDWLSSGVIRVVTALRAVREDWATKRMTSQDSAVILNGVSYTPSSLQIVADTEIYSLPPDLIEIRRIQPLLAADLDEGIRFESRDMSAPEFEVMDRWTTVNDTQTTFFFDLYGVDQIKIVPTPKKTIELELFYAFYSSTITQGGTIPSLPVTAKDALVAYVVWRAFSSVSHPDVNQRLAIMEREMDALQSISRPRQSQGITIVDDFFSADLSHRQPRRFDPNV